MLISSYVDDMISVHKMIQSDDVVRLVLGCTHLARVLWQDSMPFYTWKMNQPVQIHEKTEHASCIDRLDADGLDRE